MRIGQIVGLRKLKNIYDDYVDLVLGDPLTEFRCLERQPGEESSKRLHVKFKVIKELPSVKDYEVLKRQKFITTVEDLLDDAYTEIESLAEEMRSWYDNLSYGLQESDRGNRVNDAADSLENINRQDSGEGLEEIEVYFLPSRNVLSRGNRASEAASKLREAVDALRNVENSDEFDDIADQCNSDADELENIEFPGMYD